MEKAGNDSADRIVAFDQIYSVTRKAGRVMNSCALRVGWPGFVADDDMLNEGTTFLREGMGFARGHGSAAPLARNSSEIDPIFFFFSDSLARCNAEKKMELSSLHLLLPTWKKGDGKICSWGLNTPPG